MELTDEKEKAKVDHAVLAIEEEKRSRLSKLQIHKTWRSIMREHSIQELRGDIKWMAKKHLKEVENKDRRIHTLLKALEESETQHLKATSSHFVMLDQMINVHDVRLQGFYSLWNTNFKRSFRISTRASMMSVIK